MAIEELTHAEEKIIEDETCEYAKIDSIGIMIDATIAGILDMKTIDGRVSPPLPFVASFGNEGIDDEEQDGQMESPT